MSFMVGNVHVGQIQEAVPEVLGEIMRRSNNRIWFDLDAAANFWQTPDKFTEARSRAVVRVGQFAATAYTLAFLPSQGTGDRSARSPSAISNPGPYPLVDGSVIDAANPRDKSKTEREIHLPVGSFSRDGRFRMGAGCLDLVGIDLADNSLVRLGSLGQTHDEYEDTMATNFMPGVKATWTVWRYGPDTVLGGNHAVFNATDDLQIATFVGIPRGWPTDLLLAFNPSLPVECK